MYMDLRTGRVTSRPHTTPHDIAREARVRGDALSQVPTDALARELLVRVRQRRLHHHDARLLSDLTQALSPSDP